MLKFKRIFISTNQIQYSFSSAYSLIIFSNFKHSWGCTKGEYAKFYLIIFITPTMTPKAPTIKPRTIITFPRMSPMETIRLVLGISSNILIFLTSYFSGCKILMSGLKFNGVMYPFEFLMLLIF